jgi:predicted phosphodiesterase
MSDDEIMALLGDEPADIVVCGGSHVPFERDVADVRIVNVGSVGEAPEGGVAHGAIIASSQTGFAVRMLTATLEP